MRVGPYEVVVLLGAGGMAEVYRARDTRLGRDVAIKMVSEALGAEGPRRERFEREARLASSLSHPNVVAVYDVGFQDDKPYLVTELLRGETLRERLTKGPVPIATALEWAAQMAQGLAAAHESGIVHRDLKLENVFVTRDGHVKLLDFGIAKGAEPARKPHGLMEETAVLPEWRTGTGIVLGTPGYMSPEQVRGEAVDARTDFFSLGAILYEVLGGRQAFPAATAVESSYAILHTEPDPLPATVPPPVAQVVRRCLEKEPRKRFQSARDLAFHLELLRTPTGSNAPTDAHPGLAVRLRRWGQWPWLLSGLLAAIAVSGLTYLVVRSTRHPPPSVERMTFRRGTVWAGRFTPEGRVVYSATWGAEPEQVFTQTPGSTDAQPLGVPDARLLAISAQGEFAVALNKGGIGETLAVVPGAGGVPREVTENIFVADWSRTGELAVVRYVNGRSQLEYPVGTTLFESTGIIGFPRVSPSGDVVAFWSMPNAAEPNELMLVDRKGSVRHVLQAEITGLAWAPSGKEVWFSEVAAIWASPLGQEKRLVYQGVSAMKLLDISADGKVLINVDDEREEVAFIPPGQQHELELPWVSANYNDIAALSDDGRRLLVTYYPTIFKPLTYIRPTDGSAPLKLGLGRALAFSPDEKSVLATVDQSELLQLPVGVGIAQKFPMEGLNIGTVRWLRDGKRLVATVQRKGETQWRLFVIPLAGGVPTLLTDGPAAVEVSRDDRFAAVLRSDGMLTLYPLEGGPPLPLPELGRVAFPVGWTSGGDLWVSVWRASREGPSHLVRYDISKRRVVEERIVGPADLTGLASMEHISITPDSQSIALQYLRRLGVLYLLDGLAPPRQ
jgi:eukaryotic-like serine/threonine-protein kinase